MGGLLRLGHKQLLLLCVSLGVVCVWMSLHYSSKPVLSSPYSSTAEHKANSLQQEKRSDCDLKLPFLNLQHYAVCQVKLPFTDSCKIAKELFSGEAQHCPSSNVVHYCKFSGQEVFCDTSECKANVKVGHMDSSSGLMVWREYSSGELVTQALVRMSRTVNHLGYAFIRCMSFEPNPTQLFILPLSPPDVTVHRSSTPPININIIFIDSVSYYHFHRSLHKTLHALEALRSGSIEVFSYPLFQSLKSRTYENLQALFSGEVDVHQSFGTQEMPLSALKLQHLLKPLKDKGYHNLVMEDLCWLWEWGFSKDLLVHNKSLARDVYWRHMTHALDRASVTSYGISPSSCEILDSTGFPDPFHGLPTICYNGRYQHEYIFDYLDLYHKSMLEAGVPFTSFYSSNVAHDEWGTRVKTIDKRLAEHVTTASRLSNTVTIILSDHGNTYGTFPQYHQQGRDEAYHPMLYIVVSEGAKRLLGNEVLANMEYNQNRLVTVLDVHHLLKFMTNPSLGPSHGLVTRLSADRQCLDLPLFQPNICICSDVTMISLPAADLKLLLEFATGSLNNKLLDAVDGTSNMRCNMLLPINHTNLHISKHQSGAFQVSMDINYPSGFEANVDTFFVTLLYNPTQHSYGRPAIQLLAFERRSMYSIYRSCGDGPPTESLCICGQKPYLFNKAVTWLNASANTPPIVSQCRCVRVNSCIYVVPRSTGDLVCTYYSVNICSNETHTLHTTLNNQRSLFYSIPEAGWLLRPLDIRFLLVVKLSDASSLLSSFHFSSSVL